MGKHVWIGPRGHEEWVKAPAPRAAFQPVGWSATTQGRNGRVTGRRSRVTHMEYELSWPVATTELARKVGDWFYGLASDGLIYWLDPMQKNVLPAHWSFPGLGVTDGPILYGGLRPTAVQTAANSKGLPAVSARYSAAGGLGWGTSMSTPSCYIPIPPGHAAHIGVHSADEAQDASVVSFQRVNGDTPVGDFGVLPAIAASDSTRFTAVVPRDASMTGIELKVDPGRSRPIATNLFTNPGVVSTAGFSKGAAHSGTMTYEGGAVRWTAGSDSWLECRIDLPFAPVGEAHRLLVRARANRPIATYLRIQGSSGTPVVTITEEWQWFETIYAPTATTGTSGPVFRPSDGHVAGDWIEIDRVLFAVGTYAGPWFSGNSPDASWDGAVNASTSTLYASTATSSDLAGMMVEVLPVGQSPTGQGFIRGGGNSGCRIFEPPTEVANSAYYDRMSVAANLIEVGP